MGNCIVSVHVTGAHHNGSEYDIDQLAAEFVDKLSKVANVTAATIVSGGEHNLMDSSARFPLKSEKPAFYAPYVSPGEGSGD